MILPPKSLMDEMIEGHPVQALTDADFYKFTMMNAIWRRPEWRNLRVRFSFKNRTSKVNLLDIIDARDIEAELNHVSKLRYSRTELHYLRGTYEYDQAMFPPELIKFLEQFTLDNTTYRVGADENGRLEIIFEGPWIEVMIWETICLSIVKELHTRALLRKMTRYEREMELAGAMHLLNEKVVALREVLTLSVTEFGTRRRASRAWHDYMLGLLAESGITLQGTSNTMLAAKYGLVPMGTSAHELPMTVAAHLGATEGDVGILRANDEVVKLWWETYGESLSIFLPDTFGSDHFFAQRSEEELRNWKGDRHDSGDPFEYGESRIRQYESFGIDPREKIEIFSDGLNLQMALALHDRFHGRIRDSYGWGTGLTHDWPTIMPMSLVVKPTHVFVNGVWVSTVKLSDNLVKAIGTPAEIARYKRIFGYTRKFREECRV